MDRLDPLRTYKGVISAPALIFKFFLFSAFFFSDVFLMILVVLSIWLCLSMVPLPAT
ncbi:unnamed protein product [Brassica napus]|uniref:(rape) hypothetical protein n=1 Tax=Brassica napus TaxID=3708 RepID=A0A816J9L3_BRANA|nr:unnamed protein product [Brassica napus]